MRESFMTFSEDTDGNGQGGGRHFRVAEEDVTQNCMRVDVSGMEVEVEVNERQSHCM